MWRGGQQRGGNLGPVPASPFPRKTPRWQMCRYRQIWPLKDWGWFQWCPAQLKCAPRGRSWSLPLWRGCCRHSGCWGPWLPSQNPTSTGRDACIQGRQREEEAEVKGRVQIKERREANGNRRGGRESKKQVNYIWHSGNGLSSFQLQTFFPAGIWAPNINHRRVKS